MFGQVLHWVPSAKCKVMTHPMRSDIKLTSILFVPRRAGQSGRAEGRVERAAGESGLTGRLLFTHRLVVISPTQSFGDRQTKTDRATNKKQIGL